MWCIKELYHSWCNIKGGATTIYYEDCKLRSYIYTAGCLFLPNATQSYQGILETCDRLPLDEDKKHPCQMHTWVIYSSTNQVEKQYILARYLELHIQQLVYLQH